MKVGCLTLIVAALAVAGCADAPSSDETARQMAGGACGRIVTTAEGVTTEHIAEDFGAGLIGMRTETVDRAGQRRQRFALYDPRMARIVRVDAPPGSDLFAVIDRVSRDEPVRQSLRLFAEAMRSNGFQVAEGRADPEGHPRLACVTEAFMGGGQMRPPAAIPRTTPVDGRLLLP